MKKTVKALLVLAMLLSSLMFFAGCDNKKDDSKKDEDKKASNTIVGSWKYESGDYTYTFNEDGTGEYLISSTKMEFTYTTDSNKISILYKGNTAAFETEYAIDGDTLNIKDSFGKDTIYKRK